jgi:hypothetical protein
MIQEPFNDPDSGKRKRSDERQSEPVQYVGSPTEYADAEEMPEAISLFAKILAGGALTWAAAMVVLVILTVGCAACAILAFASGLVLQ